MVKYWHIKNTHTHPRFFIARTSPNLGQVFNHLPKNMVQIIRRTKCVVSERHRTRNSSIHICTTFPKPNPTEKKQHKVPLRNIGLGIVTSCCGLYTIRMWSSHICTMASSHRTKMGSNRVQCLIDVVVVATLAMVSIRSKLESVQVAIILEGASALQAIDHTTSHLAYSCLVYPPEHITTTKIHLLAVAEHKAPRRTFKSMREFVVFYGQQ